jgi:hypothetical protein
VRILLLARRSRADMPNQRRNQRSSNVGARAPGSELPRAQGDTRADMERNLCTVRSYVHCCTTEAGSPSEYKTWLHCICEAAPAVPQPGMQWTACFDAAAASCVACQAAIRGLWLVPGSMCTAQRCKPCRRITSIYNLPHCCRSTVCPASVMRWWMAVATSSARAPIAAGKAAAE